MRISQRRKKAVQRAAAATSSSHEPVQQTPFEDHRPEAAQQLQLKEALNQKTVGQGDVAQRVMWYMSPDHKTRIMNLAALTPKGTLPEGHATGFFGSSYLQEDSDSTITLWGHTDEDGEEFGDLTSDHLVDALMVMGLEHSQHTELNILSCAPHTKFNTFLSTYAQRVQASLNALLNRPITVRTLPYAPEGMDSRLIASSEKNEMLYVIFPADKIDVYKAIRALYLDLDEQIEEYRTKGFTVLPTKYSSIIKELMLPVKM